MENTQELRNNKENTERNLESRNVKCKQNEKKLRKKRYYCDGKALSLELWRWLHTFTPVIKWHNSSHTSCPVQVPGGDSVQELGKLGKDTGSLYTSFATSFGSNKFLKKGGKK